MVSRNKIRKNVKRIKNYQRDIGVLLGAYLQFRSGILTGQGIYQDIDIFGTSSSQSCEQRCMVIQLLQRCTTSSTIKTGESSRCRSLLKDSDRIAKIIGLLQNTVIISDKVQIKCNSLKLTYSVNRILKLSQPVCHFYKYLFFWLLCCGHL